jgi:hypothetical protein
VVRCWTVDRNEFDQMITREPSKEEIRCCSLYTEEAIARNADHARVHLVLGQVAARTLLKGEYRKDQKTFWSRNLKAWVICTYHPSYFLRGAPRSRLKEFREALSVAVGKAGQRKGKFSYIEAQDYVVVLVQDLVEEEKAIREVASKGIRVVFDIEDDWEELVAKSRSPGKNVIVCVGYSYKRGKSRVVFLEHPQVKQSEVVRKKKLEFLKRVLEDSDIKKGFQHGSYDIWKLEKLLGIKVRGYDHDTQYSEYLRFSHRRTYSLESIADVRFREFAGYKEILDPYRDKKTKMVHFLQVPPEIIVRYNGADCDLTKRIEIDNDRKVNQALLRVLIWAAFPLARMEERGPFFDENHDKVLQTWIPVRLDLLRARLRRIAGDEKFNPESSKQVSAVIYDKLKLGGTLTTVGRKNIHGLRIRIRCRCYRSTAACPHCRQSIGLCRRRREHT